MSATTTGRLFVAWQRRGVSCRAARALAAAGAESIEDAARLGRSHFEGRRNCAAKTLAELEALTGRPPKLRIGAADVIARALQLAISDWDEAREAATDALIALRKAGFALVRQQ